MNKPTQLVDGWSVDIPAPPDAAQLGHVHGALAWIDCKDRLPAMQKPVLVTMENTAATGEAMPGHRSVYASYYNGTRFDCEPRSGEEVATHWAEWPAPADSGRMREFVKLASTAPSDGGNEVKDSALLDWLDEQARNSQTGVSFDYCKYTEDGYVIEKGYRFMCRHFLGERKPTLREAVVAAQQATPTTHPGHPQCP